VQNKCNQQKEGEKQRAKNEYGDMDRKFEEEACSILDITRFYLTIQVTPSNTSLCREYF
jgi:hypothetical protein